MDGYVLSVFTLFRSRLESRENISGAIKMSIKGT